MIIPAGSSYNENSSITLCANLTVEGAGQEATTINTTLSSGSLFNLSNVDRVVLMGFRISKTGTAGGTAIQCGYCRYSNIKNVEITGNFSIGLNVTSNATHSCIYDEFADMLIQNLAANGTAVNILPAGGLVVNGNRFIDIVAGPSTAGGVIAFNDQGGHENIVIQGDLSTGDTTAGIGVQVSANTRNLVLIDTTIEKNNLGYSVASGAEGTKCIGCQIGSNTTNFSDNGNRSVIMSNVSGVIPSWSLDQNGNVALNGIGLSGAGSVAQEINGPSGWTVAGAGTNVAQINSGSFQALKPILNDSVTFANLGTPSNGTVVYCSDCNATCAAGGGTGRTCFRENGAWTH